MNLQIKGITKKFGEKEVLNGVTLNVCSGKALGFLGRNGAGKTTTIRIIMGIFDSDSGEVLIDGKKIDRTKIKIGYLPEEKGLYGKKTILDQMVYFGTLRGMSKKEATISSKNLLEKLKMTEYINKKAGTLSKGNQQKIQLAITLINDPDIIILDEPFSGLDPVNSTMLKSIVTECVEKQKIVLFSSHQMGYIEEFCEDIVILNNGKIVLDGKIKDIKRSYDRSKIIVSCSDIETIKNNIEEESYIHNNKLIVQLKSVDDKNKLINKISTLNVDIDEIKVYEPSVNDIFISYTKVGA